MILFFVLIVLIIIIINKRDRLIANYKGRGMSRNRPNPVFARARNIGEPMDLGTARYIFNEIHLLRLKCQYLSRQVRGLRSHLRGRDYTTQTVCSLKPPTFCSCGCQSPVYFLYSLVEYVRLTQMPFDYFKYVVGQALKGTARDWFYYSQHRVNSVFDFQRLFLERFWNDTLQLELRRKLEYGNYTEGAAPNQSRSDYAIRIYNESKALRNPPEGWVVIERLSRHFDRGVQTAVLLGGITSIEQLVDFLDATPAVNQDEVPDGPEIYNNINNSNNSNRRNSF